ncbi:MAG: DUF4340 domain-containing protein [Planctomycetes bacterium]|nr:DUF4340 domain-containing protein [Planctomycetota bacterium]
MGRHRKTTAALASVAAVVWLSVLMWGSPKQPWGEGGAQDRLLPHPVPDFVAVTIENDYGELRFEAEEKDEDKVDRDWRMLEPASDLADSQSIGSLLGQLVNMRKGTPVEGLDAAEAGLDKPQAVVRLRVKGDDEEKVVEFGGKAGFQANVYARVRGAHGVDGDDIWVVGSGALRTLARDPASFRARSVLTIAEYEVAKFEMERRDAERTSKVVLSRSDKQADWEIESPIREDAEQDRANGVLSGVLRLRIEDFPDPAKPLADYGIETPIATLSLSTFEGDDHGPIRIGFVEKEDGPAYYATIEGREGVFHLGSETRFALFDLAGVRSRLLLSDPEETVENTVRIQFGPTEDHWAIARDAGGKWKIVVHPPGGAEAKDYDLYSTAMYTLLNKLGTLRIEEFVAGEPTADELKEWELDPPRETVVLYGLSSEESKVLAELRFGKKTEKGVYATVSGRTGVFLAEEDADVVATLAPGEIRDRAVWALPPDGEIVRIEIRREGAEPLLHARDEKGDWKDRAALRPADLLGRFRADPEKGWAAMEGAVEAPKATVEFLWKRTGEGAVPEEEKGVLSIESVPEKPAEGAPMPEYVKASVDGVPGVFWLHPETVWAVLGM